MSKDNYIITQQLGKGGQAVVFSCTDLRDSSFKVIKVMPLTSHHEFRLVDAKKARLESETLVKLNHPNIIKIFQSFEDQFEYGQYFFKKALYIVLERVSGDNLRHYISPMLGKQKIIKLYRDIREGLLYLHKNQIVHRDISPQNILIDINFTAKITDFGICTNLEGQKMKLTKVGAGKYSYMSKQLVQKCEVSFYTDYWAFGVVLLELVLQKNVYDFQGKEIVFPCLDSNFPKEQIKILKSNKKYQQFIVLIEALLEGSPNLRRMPQLSINMNQVPLDSKEVLKKHQIKPTVEQDRPQEKLKLITVNISIITEKPAFKTHIVNILSKKGITVNESKSEVTLEYVANQKLFKIRQKPVGLSYNKIKVNSIFEEEDSILRFILQNYFKIIQNS